MKIALFLLAVSLADPETAANDEHLAPFFARTARLHGADYVTHRSLLERRGKDTVPFLERQLKSSDWRARDLARALLPRIGEPEKAARWLRVLARSSAWYGFTFRDDGSLHVTLKARDGTAPRKPGRPEAAVGVVQALAAIGDRESAPLLIDTLKKARRGKLVTSLAVAL